MTNARFTCQVVLKRWRHSADADRGRRRCHRSHGYVYWSPQLEKLISGAGPHGEIWITGSASKFATDAVASRCWTVVPKAGARLEK